VRGDYRSNIKPQAVLATLGAIEARFDVPPVVIRPLARGCVVNDDLNPGWFSECRPTDAARLVEGWAFWFAREVMIAANDLLRGAKLTGCLPKPSLPHSVPSSGG